MNLLAQKWNSHPDVKSKYFQDQKVRVEAVKQEQPYLQDAWILTALYSAPGRD